MRSTKTKMIDILKELRDECGCKAIKAEFEAEGTRTDELIMLNEIVNRAEVPLTIKIGGCEAVRDLDQCRLFGASGIIAPMIESPFALSKFIGAVEKIYGEAASAVEWTINAETVSCHENYDAILEKGANFLDMVGIGRVDMSASMGLSRAEINSDTVFDVCVDIAKRSREAGLSVCFGGGISFEAIPFIQAMTPYADRFETRKVHFDITDDEKILRRGIFLAMQFEMLYLETKCAYYDRLASEDRARLEMMHKRIAEAEREM